MSRITIPLIQVVCGGWEHFSYAVSGCVARFLVLLSLVFGCCDILVSYWCWFLLVWELFLCFLTGVLLFFYWCTAVLLFGSAAFGLLVILTCLIFNIPILAGCTKKLIQPHNSRSKHDIKYQQAKKPQRATIKSLNILV